MSEASPHEGRQQGQGKQGQEAEGGTAIPPTTRKGWVKGTIQRTKTT